MFAFNSESFSSTYFLSQEERKRLHYNSIRKIILISGVVLLCLISVMIIREIHSETSDTDQKLAASSIASSSSLTPGDDPKELSKHTSTDSIFRRKNETIVSNGHKSSITTTYLDESSIGPTETVTPYDDSDKTRNDYPDLCKNASFDTILSFKNDTFVLKDDWYWKLSNNRIAPKYPKPLSQKWSGLPGKIDAAFTDYNDIYTYFFKGSQYWKFNDEKLEDGFPREIAIDFLGVPNNLQASSMGNRFIGEVYFFKGDVYWVVNMNNRPYRTRVIHPIAFWPGIPSDLDAALRSSDYITYFFKGDRYYKYHEEESQSRVIKEGRTASDWFGCDIIKAT